MPTIDLPAQNVQNDGAVVIVDDPNVWSDGSEATVVQFASATSSAAVLGDPGFGLAVLPANATVTSVEFVAIAARSGGGAVPPGTLNPDYEQDATTWPTLVIEYFGSDPDYNLEVPVDILGECSTPIPADQWRYVIQGWPSQPAPPFNGLEPRFYIGPQDYPWPKPPGATLTVAELKIRVTYTLPELPGVPSITGSLDGVRRNFAEG